MLVGIVLEEMTSEILLISHLKVTEKLTDLSTRLNLGSVAMNLNSNWLVMVGSLVRMVTLEEFNEMKLGSWPEFASTRTSE